MIMTGLRPVMISFRIFERVRDRLFNRHEAALSSKCLRFCIAKFLAQNRCEPFQLGSISMLMVGPAVGPAVGVAPGVDGCAAVGAGVFVGNGA